MKKIILPCITACALAVSSNAFGMLRLLTTARTLKTQKPYHATQSPFLKLPPTNAFNTPITENHDLSQLEDLFYRNKHLKDILNQQSDMVFYHAFRKQPLNRELLVALEQELKDGLKIGNEINE